ncbi:MAG: serine/threonine-protein kinase [Nostocaceae cyanobacterium]|nr:serine/threonine-protein kinase [Nostocaceae cyanobacterium]
MSYCLNPKCPNPQNPVDAKFCLSCGAKLLLKERYRTIKPIGQGGFGRTFLAVDEDKPSKPYCVIKQFYPQAQGTSTVQKAVALFNQEALRLDELGKHPQIPELLAHFTQEDRQYLVQEFIDGQNLAQEVLQNGAFSESKIWQLLNDLLPVLQFCHSCQIIHRDIKPENIIRRRSNGKLVIVDFGASKFASQTALNRTGTSIGSPEYVPLEQIRGRAVFASDIYSLGATCIHLLTERSPFDLYDINTDRWIWRQYLKTPVSQQLSRILDKMLPITLSDRYHTAAQVLQDLNNLPPTIPSPVTQLTPSPAITTTSSPPTQSKKTASQIDSELEELKSQFLGTPKPQTEIDMELEQLKAKYLGNNG